MIKTLKKLYSGKVRDLYEINNQFMLIVATDRLSTFDVILNQIIPDKGIILTQISLYWFKKLVNICPTHLADITHSNSSNIDLMQQNNLNYLQNILTKDEFLYIKDRSLIVKKLRALPIEFVVRGYITGSGYKEYVKHGNLCGQNLPENLKNCDQLPYPIFTPTTKAQVGDHDENITLHQFQEILGKDLAQQAQNLAIKIYTEGNKIANEVGIIIADTKLEFGIDENNQIVLIDEVLTPDSSRFWDMALYKNNIVSSFDKQIVRDYLERELKWDKKPPAPDIPLNIIRQTKSKYHEILKLLCR